MVERTLAEIAPVRGHRAAFIGQTGTGKTTLVHVLLRARRYVVVLDTKGSDFIAKWNGYKTFRSLKKLEDSDPEENPKVIYRPTYDDQKDEKMMAQFFEWVYRRRNCTLYVDELAQVARGDTYPHYYGACLMQGREFNIEVWSGTQRPAWIPQIAISEAEDCYCFRLRLPQDRDRVENVAGIPSELIESLHKREFVYSRQDGGIIGPQTLVLRKKVGEIISSVSRVAATV